MDIQVHARTQQIKKLSQKLFTFLTIFRYLLYVFSVGIVFIAVVLDEGTLKLGDMDFDIQSISLGSKLFILSLYAAALFFAIRLNNSFRDLMKHFMEGNIFTKQAVQNVRAGLNNGLTFFIVLVLQKIAGFLLALTNNVQAYFDFEIEFFIAISCLGLMYILLWALEIGCDLNEESEMTI